MSAKHELLWTDLALDDLRGIGQTAQQEVSAKSQNLAERIRARVLSLRDYPLSGRAVPELPGKSYRELIVPPYRIVYEVRNFKIHILRVWHSRRKLGEDSVKEEGSTSS